MDSATSCRQREHHSCVRCCILDGCSRLLIDGVWKGISSVLVFLPQILLLFLFIGILEDSGYLARAALIADRVMRTIGLNGKAFIPLLSAYACAVPAIMATRTIENKRDRFATILVTPFMTCSARLPVYMLMIAAFIPNITFLHGFLGLRARRDAWPLSAGFLAAMTTARLLKSSILRSSRDAVHSGTAAISHAYAAFAGACASSIAPRFFSARPAPSFSASRWRSGCWRTFRRCTAGSLYRAGIGRQRDRKARPLHRASHRATRLQLEDRHRLSSPACSPAK